MIVRVIQDTSDGIFTSIASEHEIYVRFDIPDRFEKFTWGAWYSDHAFPFGYDIEVGTAFPQFDSRFGFVPSLGYSIYTGNKVEEYEIDDSDLRALKAIVLKNHISLTSGASVTEYRAYLLRDKSGYPIIETLPEYK